MTVELKAPFSTLWQGKDPFVEVEHLQGEVYRQVAQRRTLNFTLGEHSYFIKIHYGTTLKEILKNLLTLRLPILDAGQEWRAIHRLAEVGVNTMQGVAFACQGLNPLSRRSFIITDDLNPATSLEDFCRDWQTSPPGFAFKRQLIAYLAQMVRQMHLAGVNHRDCYLCHFLLDDRLWEQQQIKLSVIDLHRAQIRSHVPRRWRDKDLIGLYFSSLNIGLTNRDRYYFLQTYFAQSRLKTIFTEQRRLITTAQAKAERIKKRTLKHHL